MEPPRPVIPEGESFNIGQACRIVQVPPYTLRYWESQVGLLRPARLAGGHRRYSRRDIDTVLRLKELVGRRKMTLAGARRLLLREQRGGAAEPGGRKAPAIRDEAAAKALREARADLKEILSELSR